MRYAVLFAQSVLAKDMPRIDSGAFEQIQRAIEVKLKTSPDIFGKPLRRSLKGHRSLRVGNYRIVYRIDTSIVRIIAIIHRSQGYEDVVKRL